MSPDLVLAPVGIDDASFFRELTKEDALGVVLRGAIHIDHELIALVDETSACSAAIKHSNFDYFQRVMIGVALGLNPELAAPLKTIGSLRNRFAHVPNVELGKNEVDAIYKSLSPDHKKIVQTTFKAVRSRHPNSRFASTYSDLVPLDKLVFLIIALRQALRAARNQNAVHKPPAQLRSEG